MKNKFRILILAVVIASVMPNCVYGEEVASFHVNAKSALLMEAETGNILYAQNPHEKLAPASLTKIMTLLLIYEAVESGKFNWDTMVTVSEHAASMGGSQVFLEPFEQQRADVLTKCIAVASANDAAVAMAEMVAGTEGAFVDLMNRKAAELSLTDTHFENACGLDAPGHVTSAHDIAVMSRVLTQKYPDIYKYTNIWQDAITHKTKRGEEEFGLTNTNRLIKWYQGATGLKTGSTSQALFCVSGTAERAGLSLISVIMGAPDYKTRFQEAMNLFDYGFANYGITKGKAAGEAVGEVLVYKGEQETITALVKEEAHIIIRKGENEAVDTKIDLLPSINAPIKKGAKLGEIVYLTGGKEAGRSDLIAADHVAKRGLWNTGIRLMNKWLSK